jgi:hypothetical protein
MKYLTGQARLDFFEWYYKNDKYKDLTYEIVRGGAYFDELPDTMTEGVVFEWMQEIGVIKNLKLYSSNKLRTANKKYNKSYDTEQIR